VVINLIDDKPVGSWLRRARTDDESDVGFGAESSTAALAVSSRDGWDPWEVWLLHIDQPRRNLAGRGLKSAD
jgi:hypothetical protein